MEQKTLRDEFAMAALTGMELHHFINGDIDGMEKYFSRVAEIAYKYADAMMKEREKHNKQ